MFILFQDRLANCRQQVDRRTSIASPEEARDKDKPSLTSSPSLPVGTRRHSAIITGLAPPPPPPVSISYIILCITFYISAKTFLWIFSFVLDTYKYTGIQLLIQHTLTNCPSQSRHPGAVLLSPLPFAGYSPSNKMCFL